MDLWKFDRRGSVQGLELAEKKAERVQAVDYGNRDHACTAIGVVQVGGLGWEREDGAGEGGHVGRDDTTERA